MINIFGTSGIRGILGETHSIEDIIKITYATNEYFKGRKVLIGYDCRKHSLPLAYISASSLLIYGVDISIAGVISTPSLQSYLKRKGEFEYGIMFTASHNPKQYFGLKVFDGKGVEVSREKEERISEIYYSLLERDNSARISWENSKTKFSDITENVIDDYIYALETLFPTFDEWTIRLRLAADYCNCSSLNTAGKYLSKKFPRVIHVNNTLDGRFPNREPEPTPETIKEIVNKLRGKIDIGVSFDGDGDRGMIFDGSGNIYWGDEIGVIVSLMLKDELGISKIVTPISSSTIVNEVLSREGIEVIWTKVGAKNVVDYMLENKINLGFEENGGLIYLPHIAGRDGLITLLFTLKAIEKRKDKLENIRGELPKTFVAKHAIYVKENKRKVFTKLKKKILSKYEDKIVDIVDIDGIKLFFSDNKAVLIRPSGTEPKIRIFTEAKTKRDAEELSKEIMDIAKDIIRS